MGSEEAQILFIKDTITPNCNAEVFEISQLIIVLQDQVTVYNCFHFDQTFVSIHKEKKSIPRKHYCQVSNVR
jgi:hypothetical protein